MKSYDEFLEQQIKSRGSRPGEPRHFPYDNYLGITKSVAGYSIFIHPEEENRKNVSFFEMGNYLCDILTEFPDQSYDVNFSDNFPLEEMQFIRRFVRVCLGMERYRRQASASDSLARQYWPIVARALARGLGDKFK